MPINRNSPHGPVRIVVAGLVTQETNVDVEQFPIGYAPIHYPFHGIHQNLAGVGFNVSIALSALGNSTKLLSLLGDDHIGREAVHVAAAHGIDTSSMVAVPGTSSSQTVVLVDRDGRRQIHLDLKDLQAMPIPHGHCDSDIESADMLVACNINFARPLLGSARRAGVRVATDVHALSDFDDDYNREFMAAADVLFLSDERLPCTPQEAVVELRRRFAPQVIVVGMGARGAWLSQAGFADLHVPPIAPRPIVNTVGAGDALFAAFVDQWTRSVPAPVALQRAVLFAGWKCGARGATQGLLDREGWDCLIARSVPS